MVAGSSSSIGIRAAPQKQQRSASMRRMVAARAVQELQELDALPPTPTMTPEEVQALVDNLNEQWAIPGALAFGVGMGDLPVALLVHPQTGMKIVVYLYGATIAQWVKTDGTATFYDGPDDGYSVGQPIRGGVSVHFPQHREGALPEHGFAHSMLWEVVGAGFENHDALEGVGEWFDKYGHLVEADKHGEARFSRAAVAAAQARVQQAKAEALRAWKAEGYTEEDLANPDIEWDLPLAARLALLADVVGAAADEEGEDEDEEAAGEGAKGAARAEGKGAEEEEDEDEEEGLPMRVGPNVLVDTDLRPFIMLRLRDTERTRALWPHKFELVYKITLEVQDDMDEEDIKDAEASFAGVADVDEDEGGEGGAEELALPDEAAAQLAASARTGSGSDGEAGGDDEGEDAVDEEGAAAAALDEEDEDADEEEGGLDDAGDDEDDDEDGEDEDDDDDDDGLQPGLLNSEIGLVNGQDPVGPGVQIRQEFWLNNGDDAGSPAMRFQLGTLARIKTMDQRRCADWVKILGLGGAQVFNYTDDPRYPNLELNMQDFLHFGTQPVDKTFVDTRDASVYLCPGNRTHYEFQMRQGFRDMFVAHPGGEVDPAYNRATAVGMGYVATQKRLPPGDTWTATSVLRFHNRYWRDPLFGDDSIPPLEPIPREQLLADREDDGEAPPDPRQANGQAEDE